MSTRLGQLNRQLCYSAKQAMEFVSTKNAPPPAAPYSQAIKVGGTLYMSGQIPLTPEGKMVEGTIQDRARQCFANMDAVLKAAGTSKDKVIKLSVFGTNMADFAKFNEVYVEYFAGHLPCRTFVAVKELPLGADIEIEGLALL